MQDQSIQALRPGRRAILQSLLCGAAAGFAGMPAISLAAEPEGEIDFSYAGYGAGVAIPGVPAVLRLNPTGAASLNEGAPADAGRINRRRAPWRAAKDHP